MSMRTKGPSSSTQSERTIKSCCFNELGRQNLLTQFVTHFESFPLREERIPCVATLNDTTLNFKYLGMLKSWKFTNTFKLTPHLYHVLVRVFYLNAICVLDKEREHMVTIRSYVMGKTILLNADVIAKHLGLDNVGEDNEKVAVKTHLSTNTSVNQLDIHDRLLHLMVSWWFRPSCGKYSSFRVLDIWWLHCFQNAKRIKLPKIIFSELVDVVNYATARRIETLVYDCFLSNIFIKEGIDCSLDVAIPLATPINFRTLNKCHFELVGTEWKRKGKRPTNETLEDVLRDVDDPVNDPQNDDDGSSTVPTLLPQYRVIMEAFDVRFAAMQSHLDGRLTDIHRQQLAMQTQLEEIRSVVVGRLDTLSVMVVAPSPDLTTPPPHSDA